MSLQNVLLLLEAWAVRPLGRWMRWLVGHGQAVGALVVGYAAVLVAGLETQVFQ